MRLPFIVLAALPLTACLRAPPQATDTGTPVDAGIPTVLSVETVGIEDFHGREHAPEAVPLRPVAVVAFSTLPFVERDEDPPIWFFRGPADADLAGDLAGAPLRSATRERLVPSTLVRAGSLWTLSADEPSGRQSDLTLAVGAWVRSQITGARLEAPFLLGLVTSGAPEAGARVSASWPPDGAAAVSPSLRELALRFDGPVELPEGSLSLLEGGGREGASVTLWPCPSVGWDDGWCARLVPDRPLRRGTVHRLVLDDRALDASGAPVGALEVRFTTALDDDDEGPSLRPPVCAIDEEALGALCVLADDARVVLRLSVGEPARIALELGERTVRVVAPRGDAVLEVRGLEHTTSHAARIVVRDTGDRSLTVTPRLSTTEPLASVAIVEVRADPNGPEPTQEYVEVLNFGAMPVDLDGFWLADRPDAEGDPLHGTLAPSERALVVPSGFDPEEASDPAVPPGVALIRVDRSLGSGGLANAGEPVFLRDGAGRRISAAPARSSGGGGRCVVREGPHMRTADGFSVATCTPGVP